LIGPQDATSQIVHISPIEETGVRRQETGEPADNPSASG
jgi:hypothetical protein